MSRRLPETCDPRHTLRQSSNFRFDILIHDARSHIIWEWLKIHVILAPLFRSSLHNDHRHSSTGSTSFWPHYFALVYTTITNTPVQNQDFQANNSNLVTQANRRPTAFPKDKGQLVWVSETHLTLLSTLCERSQHSLDLVVLYKKRFGTEVGKKICHRAQK